MTDPMRHIEDAVKSRRLAPVYVFWGKELWAKKKCVQMLKEALVPKGMESFNFDHFYAPENSVVSVIDSALTQPMMADYKLVLVENCQKWDASERKLLTEYFKNPNQETCLVLDFDLDKTGKMGHFFLLKSDKVTFFEFPKPSPWELEDYIGRLAESCGVELDKPSRAILAEFCGDDIELMRRELEKLKLFKYGETRIQAEDVEALTGRTRLVSRYELQKNISGRNVANALIKAQDILNSGETAIGVLSVLARYIGQLLSVKALAAEGVRDKYGLAARIGLPANIANSLIQEQMAFSSVELRQALKLISTSDDMLKGSRLEGGTILARLITSFLSKTIWTP